MAYAVRRRFALHLATVKANEFTHHGPVATHFAPVVVFAGSFLVYLLTLAPTVYGLDSAEFGAAVYNLGVPHATGYPLYLLIGKLFTYLPFGDVAYRLNLMSAFFASSTVTVVYLLTLAVSRRVILSIVVAGFLAFSYYFWSSAVFTEVYSLHAFLTATTIYLLTLWNRGSSDKLLYAAALVWGLSFGNHMTTILLGPAIAFVIGLGLWERRLSWWQLLPLASCFLVTLAIYAYLPLRYLAEATPYVIGYYTSDGVLVRTDTTTIDGMLSVLTARQFKFLFESYRGMAYLEQLWQVMSWIYANFLGVGMVLGLLGLIRNFVVDKRRFVFLGLIFSTNVLFFANYGAPDKAYMFVAGHIVFAVWVADGLVYLVNLLRGTLGQVWQEKITAGRWIRARHIPWELGLLVLPIMALWINYSYADLSSFTTIRDQYPRIMRTFEPDSLVLARWPDSAPMQYFQLVEGMRPDVQVLDRFMISPQAEEELIERSLPHRIVYVFGHQQQPVSPRFEAVPVIFEGFEVGYLILPSDPK